MLNFIEKNIQKKENSYNKITSDKKVFTKINYDEFFKIINQEKKLVYIGKPSCPKCRKFISMLYSILKDKNIKIYYFNIESSEKDIYLDLFKELKLRDLPSVIITMGNKTYKRMNIYNNVSAIKAWITSI